jgi:hypothetical protein
VLIRRRSSLAVHVTVFNLQQSCCVLVSGAERLSRADLRCARRFDEAALLESFATHHSNGGAIITTPDFPVTCVWRDDRRSKRREWEADVRT